ncbi:MAG TPA: TniQ family protein [Streptosporangiaceae bacterium]|nr:TniQ family protein [Streptosporangiaceae bacterium]
MSLILPPAGRVPVVPRPRHGELSGSYLARVARVNGTDLRTFASLLGRLPSLAPTEELDLAVMVLTLNAAAFDRLLSYTGLAGDQLIRAIPSLTPRTFRSSRESPAIRVSFLRGPAADCPGCRNRRGGAYADTRVFAHKTACLRHGYWLYGQGSGQRLDLSAMPEVAAAQRRFDKMATLRGPTAAIRAYEIAGGYLQHSWRIDYHPHWYPVLLERWQQRVRSAGALPALATWQMPGWAIHPECTALAAVFASRRWAALSVPVPDRRHGLFYLHILTVLGLGGGATLRSMRVFDPLPRDIQEQASWGRLLSDPEWGSPPPAATASRMIRFIDITYDYEESISNLLRIPS